MKRTLMFLLGAVVGLAGFGIRSSYAQLDPCWSLDCSRRPRPKRPPPPKLFEVYFTLESGKKVCIESPRDCPQVVPKVADLDSFGQPMPFSVMEDSNGDADSGPSQVINQPVGW